MLGGAFDVLYSFRGINAAASLKRQFERIARERMARFPRH